MPFGSRVVELAQEDRPNEGTNQNECCMCDPYINKEMVLDVFEANPVHIAKNELYSLVHETTSPAEIGKISTKDAGNRNTRPL